MLAFQTQKTLEVAAAPTLERIQLDRQRVDRRLAPLLEHIEGHLFDPGLDVNQMKRSCGVRDNSVPIQFHAQLGLPPHAYIEECRLKTGCRLLRDSELKIWQIADLLGYSSIQVFSRAFTRWAGSRPTMYRKKSRQEKSATPAAVHDVIKAQATLAPETLSHALEGKLDTADADRLIRRLLHLYPANTLLLEQDGSRKLSITASPRARRRTIPKVPKAEPSMTRLLDRNEVEQMRADVLWNSVRTRSLDEQAHFVSGVKGFSTPALFRHLNQQARVEGRENRHRGVHVTELALLSLGSLKDKLPKSEVAGLRAEGYAWLATAKSQALDLPGAELALAEAERCLLESTDAPLATAEVLWHRGNLRAQQRRMTEGHVLNDKALALFRSAGGSNEQIGRAMLSSAQFLSWLERFDEAIGAYRDLVTRLDPERDAFLFLASSQSLAHLLVNGGAYREAETLLPGAYKALSTLKSSGLRTYFVLLEGQIAKGTGDIPRAESLMLQARNAWLESEALFLASRAALDLALLYVQTGRPLEAQNEAAQLIPWFEALNHPEAITARQIVQEATEAGAMTISVVEQLGRILDKAKSGKNLKQE